MTTKSMGYDNPAYLAVHGDQGGAIAAGSGSQTTTKFVAFTAATIKSIVARIGSAGTSNDIMSLVQISGTTTTTWTTANGTTTSGQTGYVYNTFSSGSNPILAQGDEYYVQKGTDATLTYVAACVERVIQPLANVTV
jgi:hypothetical protein